MARLFLHCPNFGFVRACRLFSSSGPSTSADYDIVVIGGGMVGNALGAALCSRPGLTDCRTLLLEAGKQSPKFSTENNFGNRVSAISPGSKAFFEQCSIWQNLTSRRVQRVDRMIVWDSCSSSAIGFDNADSPDSPLAYIAENALMIDQLVGRLDSNSVTVRYESPVKSLRLPSLNEDGLVQLELDGNEIVTSRLVVGADGYNSAVRKAISPDYVSWNYQQKAIVATLLLPEQDCGNHTAWQRFTANGPIAVLPLSRTASSLVWTTTPQEADRLLTLAEDEFVDALNTALTENQDQNSMVNTILGSVGSIISRVSPTTRHSSAPTPPDVVGILPGSRGAFPLGLGHAVRYVAPRVALVGDACHRIHPLAGQGVNLGFRDVQCLAENIEFSISTGSLSQLLKYETARQRHNAPMLVGIDLLNRLYANKFGPLVLARSLGLDFVNRIGPLKNAFKSQAVL